MTGINDILAQSQDANVEEATDFAGGGSFVKDSGVYLMRVEHAYVQESSGGALGINLSMKHSDENNTEFNTTVYITSGKAKGQKTYYEKNGKQFPLPGFTIIEDMCRLCTDGQKGVIQATKVKKTLEVYDHDQGKKLPKEVEVIEDLSKKIFKVALLKTSNNKYKAGQPTSEIVERNEISCVFGRDERSLREVNAGSDPSFINKWKEKNEGTVKDNTTVAAGTAKTSSHATSASGGVDAATAAEDDELFAD